MRKLAKIILISGLCLGLIRCGSSSTNSNTDAGAAAPTICPVGSTFSNGGCYNGNQLLSLNGVAYNGENTYARNVTINNSDIMQRFLNEFMAICGNYSSTGASCSYYQNGYIRITLQATDIVNPTVARLTIEVWPSSPYVNQGLISAVKFVDLTLFPINNSQGFEGRAYGYPGTISARKLIQFQAGANKLGDANLTFALGYDGVGGGFFANGILNRCTNISCQ